MPVFETTLLREFFPDKSKYAFGEITLNLLQMHFLLYHHLHKLAFSLKQSDYILHIQLINIYLLKKPSSSYCPSFNKQITRFCLAKKDEQQPYCDYHLEKEQQLIQMKPLVPHGIENYYLNFDHFHTLEDEFDSLKNQAMKIQKWALVHNDLDSHYKNLGLRFGDPLEKIKSRYKYLAKSFHPDLNTSPLVQQEFKQITQSYNLIKEFLKSE